MREENSIFDQANHSSGRERSGGSAPGVDVHGHQSRSGVSVGLFSDVSFASVARSRHQTCLEQQRESVRGNCEHR